MTLARTDAGPRRPEHWLRMAVARQGLASLLAACPIDGVARCAHDGEDHVWVGRIERRGGLVVVHPWGRRGRVFADLTRVVSLHPLPPHSYEERREVRRRQGNGEPAAVLPAGPRPMRGVTWPPGER